MIKALASSLLLTACTGSYGTASFSVICQDGSLALCKVTAPKVAEVHITDDSIEINYDGLKQ